MSAPADATTALLSWMDGFLDKAEAAVQDGDPQRLNELGPQLTRLGQTVRSATPELLGPMLRDQATRLAAMKARAAALQQALMRSQTRLNRELQVLAPQAGAPAPAYSERGLSAAPVWRQTRQG